MNSKRDRATPSEGFDVIEERIRKAGENRVQMPERVPYPRLPSARRSGDTRKWTSLLWSIENAEAHGAEGLRGLAVALSRIVVAEGLKQLLLEAKNHHPCGLEPDKLLWRDSIPLNEAGQTLDSLLVEKKKRARVNINDAVVLPCPWERWRLFGALANLGKGRQWGPWHQDKHNHYGVAWLPWPLVWVTNGHHSTTAGLIRGGGKFKCQETFDFTPVLRTVTTDGRMWYRADSKEAFAEVRSLAMAGIFVIGQRLAHIECTASSPLGRK